MPTIAMWLIIFAGLVAGTVTGYVYRDDQTADMATELDAASSATTAANSRIKALEADLDARKELIERQQERIAALEAALQMARSQSEQLVEAAQPSEVPQRPLERTVVTNAVRAVPDRIMPPLPQARPSRP